MKRNFPSWLDAYVGFAGHTEAPRLMHFWAGVWALAGCLRKRVWMDQIAFQWIPNFYIIFVAPPGVVSKSTTAGFAESFLRQIPGINFGPDVVTWQSLVTSFANSCESFEYNSEWYPMSPVNLVASELGNLIDMRNAEMVNLFIDLWDGRKQLSKETKMSGNDRVEGPWINMLGCTTPNWIALNMPQSTIGGGLTARCIFVYANKKEKFIAYPKYHFPKDVNGIKQKLIEDLELIATTLVGEYDLHPEARVWGTEWYEKHWKQAGKSWNDDWFEVYIARKQTHLHKLAMVLAAAQRNELILMKEDLILANVMLETTEEGFAKVFNQVGKTDESLQADRLIRFIKQKGKITVEEAYSILYSTIPDAREIEALITGAVKSGQLRFTLEGEGGTLEYMEKDG